MSLGFKRLKYILRRILSAVTFPVVLTSTLLAGAGRHFSNQQFVTTKSQNTIIFCGNKMPLDATEVFIADIIACSTCFGHHYAHQQELKSIIQWLLPVVFRAVVFKLLVWCGFEGYVSVLQDAAASCKPDT